MNAAEILRELVAIASPSSVSNVSLLRWVQEYLQPRGWHLEWMEWVDENGVMKANLLAFAGPHADAALLAPIDLAFVCHTDTVPYAATWQKALTLEESAGQLHGCGSCDVKGALACFLAAVDAANTSHMQQRIAIILTADEEIGCKGMERLLASELYSKMQIRCAVVSEPTSLRPGIAGKGYGLARISVHGKEAHSAFPAEGLSAITAAARLVTQIEERSRAESTIAADALHALFHPSGTTVNIGVIQGGTAKNIVAGECCFLVEWRSIPGEKRVDMATTLHELCHSAMQRQPSLSIDLELLRDEAGFAPRSTGALQQQLQDLLSTAPTGISFGSEASRLARIADEVIVIGPGDMRTAHSERECVPLAELESWTLVLRSIIAG
jgi:acetylornithine deacetylase